MSHTSPSALITDQGTRVLLRLEGHFYELDQLTLRALLGLRDGPPGLGISIDRDRLTFEFADDEQAVEVSASDLRRRIAKHSSFPALPSS
jgi:hypothetical protein